MSHDTINLIINTLNTMRIKKWFTLIELIIVIVMIGILSAALLPKIIGIQARARDVQRRTDQQTIATALMLYYTDNKIYPTGECNASVEYINTVYPTVCKRNQPYATTWFTEYSYLETWFLDQLERIYLTSVPKDPSHPNKTYSYTFDPTANNADVNYISTLCGQSWFSAFAMIWIAPEKRRIGDIVRSCPDGTPREYASSWTPKITNRYNFMRTMWIYDDRYKPIGDKTVPWECFDEKKNANCL